MSPAYGTFLLQYNEKQYNFASKLLLVCRHSFPLCNTVRFEKGLYHCISFFKCTKWILYCAKPQWNAKDVHLKKGRALTSCTPTEWQPKTNWCAVWCWFQTWRAWKLFYNDVRNPKMMACDMNQLNRKAEAAVEWHCKIRYKHQREWLRCLRIFLVYLIGSYWCATLTCRTVYNPE